MGRLKVRKWQILRKDVRRIRLNRYLYDVYSYVCTYMARRRSGRDGSTLCGVMTKSTETDKASLMLPQDQEFRLFRPIRLSARIIIHGLADAEVQ